MDTTFKLECLKALVASSQAVHPGMTTSRFTQTPAHIAAFAGHPHCLLWLLQTGVNPNARDYLGETSLHKAARTGSMECVNVLLSNKVQVGIPNNNGQTAAQLANSCSHTDLANYLLQVEGKQGQTQTNGSISRSVPSHGLNGGVFPHSPGLGLPGAQKADTPTNGFLAQSCQNGRNAVNGANSTCTSSNGYYGFQATNSPPAEALNGHHTNGATKPSSEQPEDCEMETDANPIVEAINGKDKPTQPFLANFMTASQNGISNGHTNGALPAFTSGSAQNGSFTNGSAQNGSFTNGSAQNGSFTNGSAQNGSFTNGSAQNGSFTNGSAQNGSFKAANGHNGDMNHANGSPASVVPKILPRLGEDIMLSDGVSKNFIPIAGCKRSREDVYVPEMKRMRTDDYDFSPMNSLKSEPDTHTPVVTEMATSDTIPAHDQDGHLPDSGQRVAGQSPESFVDGQGSPPENLSILEIPEASKPVEFAFNNSSAAKTVVATPEGHTAAASAQSRGASGYPGGPPAPVPAPLPGYSGTTGCLDAHYPRCLMGHYF
ncbi:uncharacterized protein LOC127002964 isoform X3 [Eriocheir sinensis]|uniref:uncharacterized protein LOC127002964 isoform X3 n=1 Tax=Eriocheir sinensis TaxID=95602 RepID=UPI0021C63154|nr:uncharacterized protein LOC127002964 isoform X3 [Eriocheir sinensis]